MSATDKAKNAVDKAQGKVKEGVGKATNDDSVKAKGKRDQSKANIKDAGKRSRTPSSVELTANHSSPGGSPPGAACACGCRTPVGSPGLQGSREVGRQQMPRCPKAGPDLCSTIHSRMAGSLVRSGH